MTKREEMPYAKPNLEEARKAIIEVAQKLRDANGELENSVRMEFGIGEIPPVWIETMARMRIAKDTLVLALAEIERVKKEQHKGG